MSDFKPGTVAVATVRGVPNVRVFRTALNSAGWTTGDRVDACIDHPDSDVTDVRPLWVIDPTQLGPRAIDYPHHLRSLADFQAKTGQTGSACILRNLADQIEAQTKPPKPAEPTGLGAVVEDADGEKWTNTHQVVAWVHKDRGRAHYRDIDVVRVVREGVESC